MFLAHQSSINNGPGQTRENNTSQLCGHFICDKVTEATQHRKGKFLNKEVQKLSIHLPEIKN